MASKRIIRLGRRSGLRFGTEDEVCWTGVEERMGMDSSKSPMEGARIGAGSGHWGFFPPFPLLPPVSSSQHSTIPLLHYSIPREIPCNVSRRFPLYGVEAGGLPAKAAQRKELNVDKAHR